MFAVESVQNLNNCLPFLSYFIHRNLANAVKDPLQSLYSAAIFYCNLECNDSPALAKYDK